MSVGDIGCSNKKITPTEFTLKYTEDIANANPTVRKLFAVEWLSFPSEKRKLVRSILAKRGVKCRICGSVGYYREICPKSCLSPPPTPSDSDNDDYPFFRKTSALSPKLSLQAKNSIEKAKISSNNLKSSLNPINCALPTESEAKQAEVENNFEKANDAPDASPVGVLWGQAKLEAQVNGTASKSRGNESQEKRAGVVGSNRNRMKANLDCLQQQARDEKDALCTADSLVIFRTLIVDRKYSVYSLSIVRCLSIILP
jgi:hypothetical protein